VPESGGRTRKNGGGSKQKRGIHIGEGGGRWSPPPSMLQPWIAACWSSLVESGHSPSRAQSICADRLYLTLPTCKFLDFLVLYFAFTFKSPTSLYIGTWGRPQPILHKCRDHGSKCN
jgi:hypothetical protein